MVPDFSQILKRMEERMPWTIARKVLEENKVDRSQGWERTKKRLAEGEPPASDKNEQLLSSLTEHILCGEKLVRLYELPNEEIAAFRALAHSLDIPDSPAKACYPLSLNDDELKNTQIGHTLVARHEFPHGLALVLSTVRVVVTREPLDAASFSGEAADILSQYDEIVGLKNRRLQTMDVVWIPSEGQHVELRSDFPKQLPHQAAEAGQTSIKLALGKLLGTDFLHSSVNLFPLIPAMYHNRTEGSVVELAFGTTTASIKHEKMRRGSISLRDEDYHKGGIAALDAPISPFKISIEWKRDLGDGLSSSPELSLHSTTRDGAAAVGVLVDAVVRNCVGTDDFAYVRERIQHYLDSSDAG